MQTATHQAMYDDAVAVLAEHGHRLDRNWRAFLWLATSRRDIWERTAPHVDLHRAEVHWDSDGLLPGYWSSGEALVLRVARSLYSDDGAVPLHDLSWLDADLWNAVVTALRLHRGTA